MDSEDHEQFREFVAMRSSALLRLAMLLCGGDRHAAEDLLQTALMKTLGRWHRIDSPEAYVRQVMYRQQISRWRLRRTHAETSVPDPPDRGGVADTTHNTDLRVTVRQALKHLTDRQRAVLVLRYFEDLPEREVAEVLGCSVGTVRSTSHRAIAKLRVFAPELAGPTTGSRSALTYEEVPS